MTSLILRRVLSSKIVLVAYAVVGLVVANSHHYFAHLSGPKSVLSAILAVLAWPLIVFGANFHIK